MTVATALPAATAATLVGLATGAMAETVSSARWAQRERQEQIRACSAELGALAEPAELGATADRAER